MNRTLTLPTNLSPALASALENLGSSITDKERREMRAALRRAEVTMTEQLDSACRLETEIDEAAADLRDASTDHDEGVLTLRLEKARREYAAAIHAAGSAMGEVGRLRQQLGMSEHPMVAIPKVAQS